MYRLWLSDAVACGAGWLVWSSIWPGWWRGCWRSGFWGG